MDNAAVCMGVSTHSSIHDVCMYVCMYMYMVYQYKYVIYIAMPRKKRPKEERRTKQEEM